MVRFHSPVRSVSRLVIIPSLQVGEKRSIRLRSTIMQINIKIGIGPLYITYENVKYIHERKDGSIDFKARDNREITVRDAAIIVERIPTP